MKSLILLATLATLTLFAAHAGTCTTTTCAEMLSQTSKDRATAPAIPATFPEPVAINPASVVLDLDQALILIDPVGNQEQYRRFGRPDIVVLTRAHPDHLSIDTMIGLLRRDTVVLAPQSVIDQLPLMISNNVITPFDVGTTQVVAGISFTGLSGADDIPNGTRVYTRARGDLAVLIAFDGAGAYF